MMKKVRMHLRNNKGNISVVREHTRQESFRNWASSLDKSIESGDMSMFDELLKEAEKKRINIKELI